MSKSAGNPIKDGLPEYLFWDVDPSELDWDKNARLIIQRVFERGSFNDLLIAEYKYGRKKMGEVLTQVPNLNPKDLAFAHTYYNIPLSRFKSYSGKKAVSSPGVDSFEEPPSLLQRKPIDKAKKPTSKEHVSPAKASDRKFVASLSPHLFWDVNQSKVDLQEHAPMIVQRVLDMGHLKDWLALERKFGLEKIVEIAQQLRTMDELSLNFLVTLSGKPKNSFRCYILRQSLPQHAKF